MTSPVRAPRPTPRRQAPPAAPARPHLRVVPPPSRPVIRRRRTGAVLCVAMILVFGSLLTSAFFYGELVGGQSHLDQLDADLQQERTALAREKLELAHLQSPARIAAEAEAMGMIHADRQTWVSAGTGADPVVTGDEGVDQTDSTETDSTDTDPTSELATSEGGGEAAQ